MMHFLTHLFQFIVFLNHLTFYQDKEKTPIKRVLRNYIRKIKFSILKSAYLHILSSLPEYVPLTGQEVILFIFLSIAPGRMSVTRTGSLNIW